MSELMMLARQIQREADAITPTITATGQVDIDAVARMEKLRHEIISTEAHSPMDALMQFGCIRSVASFLLGVAQSGPEDLPAAMQLAEWGLIEMLAGLEAIRPKLEAQAGATLAELGLFQNKANLQ